MITPFKPTPRPPITQNCEEGIYEGTVASQICNPDIICDQVCRGVVTDGTGSFGQWYTGVPVNFDLNSLVIAGTPPITWLLSGGSLPASLTRTNNIISGMITAGDSTGTATFTAINCGTSFSIITMSWDVNACTAPGPILPSTIPNPVVGTSYSQLMTSTGSSPAFTISGQPAGMVISSGGNLTWLTPTVGNYTFTITATNPCGTSSRAYSIAVAPVAAATTFRQGSLAYPGLPDPAPTFVEGDFTGGGPLFASYLQITATSQSSRNGNYTFPGRGAGYRQLMWIADSLLGGSPNFMVSGFPWGITPSANTPHQSLTISGVPGKVYITSDQNGGTYTVNVT